MQLGHETPGVLQAAIEAVDGQLAGQLALEAGIIRDWLAVGQVHGVSRGAASPVGYNLDGLV